MAAAGAPTKLMATDPEMVGAAGAAAASIARSRPRAGALSTATTTSVATTSTVAQSSLNQSNQLRSEAAPQSKSVSVTSSPSKTPYPNTNADSSLYPYTNPFLQENSLLVPAVPAARMPGSVSAECLSPAKQIKETPAGSRAAECPEIYMQQQLAPDVIGSQASSS